MTVSELGDRVGQRLDADGAADRVPRIGPPSPPLADHGRRNRDPRLPLLNTPEDIPGGLLASLEGHQHAGVEGDALRLHAAHAAFFCRGAFLLLDLRARDQPSSSFATYPLREAGS